MKYNILQQDIYKDFHCLGGECKYTCCQEWGVYITREELQKVREAKKSIELQQKVDKGFVRISKDKESKMYGEIKFEKDKKCVCFDEGDGLCLLQKECGYTILPAVCKVFPRALFEYNDLIERYLYLGCEQVVDLLMKADKGIGLEQVEEANLEGLTVVSKKIGRKSIEKWPELEFYFDIKTMCLSILENRNFSIGERLLLMGLGLKGINDMVDKSEIPIYVDRFLEEADQDQLLKPFKNLNVNKDVQVIHCINFLSSTSDQASLMNLREQVFKNLEVNIEVIHDVNDTKFVKDIKYSRVEMEKGINELNKFFQDRDYIMENILVSFFLVKCLPFWDGDIWENFVFFVNIYNLYRMTLVGLAVNGLDDETFKKETTVLFRLLGNTKSVFEHLISEMKENKSDSLAHLAFLFM